MADKSAIEWTDATWNPVTGCHQVSPGCAHCYAKALHDLRHKAHLAGKRMLPIYHEPFEVVKRHANRLLKPLRWRAPRRVFVNSMSDLFHEDVPREFIAQVFAVMALAHWHDFQVLTKRAVRLAALVLDPAFKADVAGAMAAIVASDYFARRRLQPWPDTAPGDWPPSNIRVGVSVENQPMGDHRFPFVCELGEAGWATMVSLEPLLGGVRVPDRYLELGSRAWLILGGESGRHARPCDLQSMRSIVIRGKGAGVAVFVKQLGAWPLAPCDCMFRLSDAARRGCRRLQLRDRKGGDPSEWPEDLRVREFPR